MVSEEGSSWVKVYSSSGPIYAEMLKEMLERQGIPCVLKESFMTSAYRVAGLGASTGHEAILLVPEDRAEEATELLRGFMNGGE